MRRADVVVDVRAIRRVADGNDVRAELVEYRRGDVIAGAMRAIDDDPAAAQIPLVRKRALAKLDVAAGGIGDTEGLAELRRGRTDERALHFTFDRELDIVRQLRTARREEFDAVVVERIMRRADHDAGGQPQRARQVGDRGRGQRTAQVDVDTGGGQPRLERRFEQVPGNARVLADQYRRTLAARAIGFRERAARRPAELQDQLRRDRRFADAAAHAVRAEIAAWPRWVVLHCSVRGGLSEAGQGSIAFQTASASRVSRTSWTRTIRAPRSTAASAAAILPASLSPTSRPVIDPIVDFRESPARTGWPSVVISSRWRKSSRLCATDLPKPKPGSTTIRSAPIPASMQACARRDRNARTSATTSAYAGARCIVRGSPCMCIRHTAASLSAMSASAPGARSARTSLIIDAPTSSAARMTAGFIVSTDTQAPPAARASTS